MEYPLLMIARGVMVTGLVTTFVPGSELGAAAYPERAIRLVVPIPPGGGNDALGRTVAENLGGRLGQRVVVDNKGGAGGTAGTVDVVKSAPNGYTLLLGHTGALAMSAHLYPSASYDPRRDLAPVGLIGRIPLVMVVHSQAPVKTMKHFIDLARISPGTLNYGSGGSGSSAHLSAELFAVMSGTSLTHVPYKRTAQTVARLLTREVDAVFSVVPPVRRHIEAGTLRALAITSPERLPFLPGVPTVAEAGLAGFEAVLNCGLAGPARTPAHVIKKLNAQLNRVLGSEAVKGVLYADGVTTQAGAPEQYQAVIAADFAKWGEVIRRAGVKVD